MPSPIQFDPSQGPIGPVGPGGIQGPGAFGHPTAGVAKSAGDDGNFKDLLMASLEQVNRLQQEASQGVERLVTGEATNVAEVFTAVKKADVAFDLLMEIRNKLLDAWSEVKQMTP